MFEISDIKKQWYFHSLQPLNTPQPPFRQLFCNPFVCLSASHVKQVKQYSTGITFDTEKAEFSEFRYELL